MFLRAALRSSSLSSSASETRNLLRLRLLPRAMASVSSSAWGAMPDGAPVQKFTLRNAAGVEVVLATYGATVLSVKVPSRGGGAAEEVTLCHEDSLDKLRANGGYFGATVGRVANRIAGGRFSAGGRDFATARNNGPNTLHGGVLGFDKRVWAAAAFARGGKAGVTFSLKSHDGEEGFPGAIDVTAEYALSEASELSMRFEASGATQPTPINLCNHAYWNLSGAMRAGAAEHVLELRAPFYTPVDASQIPSGVVAVAGTPFDFTTPTKIGARMMQVDGGGEPGYDHNFCRAKDGAEAAALGMGVVAVVHEPASGRTMTVSTTAPGVQLYTSNFNKGAAPLDQHRAFCLETQNWPNAVNTPGFPKAILSPGETYVHETVHSFTW